jgi:hypothetical protein
MKNRREDFNWQLNEAGKQELARTKSSFTTFLLRRCHARAARFLVQLNNIVKQYTTQPQKIPNYNVILPNDHKIYQHSPVQGPPKYTQIWDFGMKMFIPSGNPVPHIERRTADLKNTDGCSFPLRQVFHSF